MVEANYQVLKVAGENTSWLLIGKLRQSSLTKWLAALSEATIAPFSLPLSQSSTVSKTYIRLLT
jgi:hypothetical protein